MIQNGSFYIKLPRFDYISQRNDYSGSCGRFRYKYFPLKKDEIDTVIVAAVYTDRSFETEDEAGRTVKQEFEYSEDGIDAAEKWIAEKYEEFAAHEPKF